jgi:endonuclease/exonuclease/phosphatase family metal-dependent hydrolase
MSRPSLVDRPVSRLLVISWNVHVGGGRLDELTALTRLRSGHLGAGTGLVLLLQETFRGGALVGAAPRGAPAPQAIRPSRRGDDVVRLADRLSLSVVYVPSMRNGGSDDPGDWEDRGSAILSTEPLSDFAAIELPLARQRRVAVMATVTPRNASATPIRFVATHFDVVPFGRGAVRQAVHLAQRLTALNDSRLPLIIGADANATSGFRHGTVTALATVAPVLRRCGTGRTSAWFARSDFIFSDLDQSAIADCETLGDRYGSDHRPIVVTIDLPTSE